MTRTDKGMPKTDTENHSGSKGRIGDVDKVISQKLTTLYSALVSEEIPPRFLDLLEQLDNAERKAQKNDT